MIQIVADLKPALDLTDRARRQVPFAASKALNDTIKQIQAAERAQIEKTFTLRRKQFVLRTVKINRQDFANKRNLRATVRIDPTRDFLAKFERGGVKRPHSGRSIAVPIDVKRGKTGVGSRRLRPKALALRAHHTAGGKTQYRGEKRTFLVERGAFRGIFQRVGRRRRSSIRLLYSLVTSVRIPASLRFERTARRVATPERLQANFHRAFEFAMRTAR